VTVKRDPEGTELPAKFGTRPDRRLLYYTANVLTRCDTVEEAMVEAYAIMRRTGRPVVVDAVFEDADAINVRTRRERRGEVRP
jgi:hypothetical protein